ncbi:hypothetical protein [Burkholderia ubonensis]|uniref:hypothetical protein n=1 Tax=Burkholderia ubonensis TaxID=101571 RepID=UPI0012FA1AD1|nr:hypothetical protein [Burkholderia ubonensis]
MSENSTTPLTTTDERATPARIPAASRSTMPARLRCHVQNVGDRLPAELRQLLLDAAAEIEGSEHAFAKLVDQKQVLQRARSANPICARRSRSARRANTVRKPPWTHGSTS